MKPKKLSREQKSVGEGALCPKCGRGIETDDGYLVQHRVLKNTSRSVIICKGSFTQAAGEIILAPALKRGNLDKV